MTRTLEWDGCLNVRDLGGVPLEGGGATRYGALVRADNIRKLSDAGWRELAGHGVVRIVDLRWPEELDEDPPRDVHVDVVHVSLLGEFDAEYEDNIAEYIAADDAAGYWASSYIEILDEFQRELRSGDERDLRGSRRSGSRSLHGRQGPDRSRLGTAPSPRRCIRSTALPRTTRSPRRT